MTIQVWVTPSENRKRNDSYSYRFSYGKRPTKRSSVVGEFDRGFNPETGEDTDFYYRSTGQWPQPSYLDISWMASSIN